MSRLDKTRVLALFVEVDVVCVDIRVVLILRFVRNDMVFLIGWNETPQNIFRIN